MTMSQKVNETGWFYHAPQRRRISAEPIQVPITSQIPGLNDLPPEFDDKPREMYFKDTDSKYIRLAKQGGRKDLLVFKNSTPQRHEPRGYPRVNWFYLEDNAVEDNCEKEDLNWQFLLPDYMVHEQHQTTAADTESGADTAVYQKQRRAPYAFDSTTVFEREGESIRDKTVKLPELRPYGYGVRTDTLNAKQDARDRKHPPSSKTQGRAAKPGEQRPAMHKLLSNQYNKEWHCKLMKDYDDTAGQQESEYTENFRKISAASNRSRKEVEAKEKVVKKPVPAAMSADKPPQQQEDKEPFKLSKFRNVPARVDSHQKPDTHRSGQKKHD